MHEVVDVLNVELVEDVVGAYEDRVLSFFAAVPTLANACKTKTRFKKKN